MKTWSDCISRLHCWHAASNSHDDVPCCASHVGLYCAGHQNKLCYICLTTKTKGPPVTASGGPWKQDLQNPFSKAEDFLWYMGSNCVIYILIKPWNFTGPTSCLSTDSTDPDRSGLTLAKSERLPLEARWRTTLCKLQETVVKDEKQQ